MYIVHWFSGEKHNILLYHLHIVSVTHNSADLLRYQNNLQYHIDGLVQERCNSSALAMDLYLTCINPTIWNHTHYKWYVYIHTTNELKKKTSKTKKYTLARMVVRDRFSYVFIWVWWEMLCVYYVNGLYIISMWVCECCIVNVYRLYAC